MPQNPLFTYADAVEHILSLLGSMANSDTARDARRAVQSAYREFAAVRRWTYYISRGRITTVAPYSTGTITYTNSTRTLTLASGTWPTWAAYGVVVIDSVPYEVASRTSSSVLILSVNSNPGANVAAGTTYTIYRDRYPMPCDFLAADQFMAIGSSIAYPKRVMPGDWLSPQRLSTTPATPRRYCFLSDPNYMGALAVGFQPPPDAAIPFDFIYHRRPRPLLIEEYKTGTATNTASSTTVTGGGTAWSSKHIGSTIRFGTVAEHPTSILGANPFTYERIITDVASATSLTVDSAIDDAHSSVKYVISDQVDIEDGAMLVAFQRCLEKQVSIARHMPAKIDFNKMYLEALVAAKEADSRGFEPRRASVHEGDYLRLADYPRAEDDG